MPPVKPPNPADTIAESEGILEWLSGGEGFSSSGCNLFYQPPFLRKRGPLDTKEAVNLSSTRDSLGVQLTDSIQQP